MPPKASVSNALEKGFFTETSYISIKDPYVKKDKTPANFKGKQFSLGKGKDFFDEKPPRMFEGEAYFDEVKYRRKIEKKEKKKNLTSKFAPSGHGKDTFSGPIEHFSPKSRPQKKTKKELSNFYTSPGKKGTGYGFPSLTFSKTPEYIPSNYDAAKKLERKRNKESKSRIKGKPFKSVVGKEDTFDNNAPFHQTKTPKSKAPKKKKEKKITVPFRTSNMRSRVAKPGATSHLDSFNTYTYKSDPYQKKPKAPKGKMVGQPFKATAPSKSSYTKSISTMNAVRSTHK
eukprot:m.106854 g.106854  ORF g.106854 m.106854 type:complete len:286 (-) comp12683_c1_seq3:2354-3211(-)